MKIVICSAPLTGHTRYNGREATTASKWRSVIDFVSVIGRIAASRGLIIGAAGCSIADKGEMFGLLIP